MRNRTFADLDRVVALGGGHGLGRVMSSLSSLGSRLTGIVTTTDNGGSTGRIRRSEGGIGSPERAAVRGDQFDQKPAESGRFPDPDVRTTGGFDGARS